MKRFAVVLLAAVALAVGYPPASVQAQTGVVLMHGKGSKNGAKAPTKILARFLESKGFLVAAPDMPWHASRIFDKTVEESMAEIDAIVAELRARGADRIVVGGHSLGANAALAYGARRDGLAGIMAIAPGHVPEIWRGKVAGDIARARDMVQASKGGETGGFVDFNQGRKATLTMAAKDYLSWYAPDGDAVMPVNAANLKPGTPLLWIVGDKDGMADRGEAYAFARAPAHPSSSYQVIGGGHRATPMKGKGEILRWLKGL